MSERARLGWSLVRFEVAPPWSVTSVSCELACRVGGAFAVVATGDEIGDALSCGCLHPGHDMGVHVQRHRRVRVPETLRHHIDRYPTRQRDRRVGVAKKLTPGRSWNAWGTRQSTSPWAPTGTCSLRSMRSSTMPSVQDLVDRARPPMPSSPICRAGFSEPLVKAHSDRVSRSARRSLKCR